MAMNDDPGGGGGGDWWTQNAPPPAAAAGGATAATEADAAQAYRDLLGREPEPGLAAQWANGIGAGGVEAMRTAIAATPEAQAYKNRTPTPTTPPTGGGGATATYGPSVAQSPVSAGGFGVAPSPYVAPVYETPTWQGGAPPTAPTLTKYTLPTQAELEASPGYQARFAQGVRASDMSAAGRGTVLNGGQQKALARYGQDYASNEYSNLVGQGQSTVALNNASTQTEFGDAFANYQARYGQFTDAATMGKNAFDTNTGNAKNAYDTNAANKRTADTDYWTRLNDLFSTGAQLSNNSYKAP